jgi:hypothetical protein
MCLERLALVPESVAPHHEAISKRENVGHLRVHLEALRPANAPVLHHQETTVASYSPRMMSTFSIGSPASIPREAMCDVDHIRLARQPVFL